MGSSKENLKLYEMQANICHALSHAVRLYILDLLSEYEMTSTQLLEVLKIPKANLSQHLSVLKKVGLIKCRKEGTYQFVSIGIPKIQDACKMVRGILLERMGNEQRNMYELRKDLNAQVKKQIE